MKKFKRLIFIALALAMSLSFSFPTSGAEILPYSSNGKIISVAHGGNWAEYPINSYEAISSAYDIGADCVSVTVKKTRDTVFVLSKYDNLGEMYAPYEGTVISNSDYVTIQNLHLVDNSKRITNSVLCTLASAIDIAKRYDRILIIDGVWDFRNEIYSFLVDYSALDNVIIRTDAGKKEIEEFAALTQGEVDIIGSYEGNLIFAAKSYVSGLSKAGCKAVMLGATNPFGVIFNQSMLSSYGNNNYATRAMMATYDPDLCGQRTDTPETWSDIIDRGYSIIETNQIRDLVEYIYETDTTRNELINLVSVIDSLDMSAASSKSASELARGRSDAQKAITTLSSLETLSIAKHNATLAFENFSIKDEDYEKRGVLRITPVKIIAVILVSSGIIGAQVYFYKKRDKKAKENI